MNSVQAIVIKVSNLEISRAFYRDILQLSDPVMDSNFWIEFKLKNGTSIFLEKLDEMSASATAKSRISWIYDVESSSELIKRLSEYGYESTTTREVKIGFELVKFYDPEGNSFYVSNKTQT